MIQMISLSIVTLTKSCLRAVDCTYDEVLGIRTLDAMPDVRCDGDDPDFRQQAGMAFSLMAVYLLVVPVVLWFALYRTKRANRLGEHKFHERYGWFLLKYRPVRPSQRIPTPRLKCGACVLSRGRGTPSSCSSTIESQ